MDNKQLTLLDLVLAESQSVPTYNLAKSYEYSPKSEEFVSLQLFRTVVAQLQDKMTEFEMRLDNKEHVQRLNDDLYKLRNDNRRQLSSSSNLQSTSKLSDNLNEAEEQPQKKKKPQNNQQLKNQENEDHFHNRLNLFEKKLKQSEDRIAKIIKDDENFKKEIERKLEDQLKKTDSSLEKFSWQAKEIINKIEDISVHHKEQSLAIYQLKDDLNLISLQQAQYALHRQESNEKNKELESLITILSKLANATHEEFNQYKETIMAIENDLLVMLKNYKDLLNSSFGVEMLKYEVEYIQKFLGCNQKQYDGNK